MNENKNSSKNEKVSVGYGPGGVLEVVYNLPKTQAEPVKAALLAPSSVKEDSLLSKAMRAIESPESSKPKSEPERKTKPIPATIKKVVAKSSTQYLLERIQEISGRVALGGYDDKTRQQFWAINVELTERGILPIDRGLRTFDGSACKQNDIKQATAPYMRDLQAIDMYFVWRWHNGRHAHPETKGGLFKGIFQGDLFNKAQADKIAALKWRVEGKPSKSGKRKLAKLDAEALDLPAEIQEKLIVLRSDAVRQRQDYQKDKMGELHNQKLDVEDKLRAYINGNPKTRLSVDLIPVYGNVWLSVTIAKGSYAQAIIEYQRLSGESEKRNRDFIRDKFKAISKALSA